MSNTANFTQDTTPQLYTQPQFLPHACSPRALQTSEVSRTLTQVTQLSGSFHFFAPQTLKSPMFLSPRGPKRRVVKTYPLDF